MISPLSLIFDKMKRGRLRIALEPSKREIHSLPSSSALFSTKGYSRCLSKQETITGEELKMGLSQSSNTKTNGHPDRMKVGLPSLSLQQMHIHKEIKNREG